MQRENGRGYGKRLESIGSLIFLVMILAVSIDQGQRGNNGLIVGAIEFTQDEANARGALEPEAKQQAEEFQDSENRGLTVEKIRSLSIQEWNKITSAVDGAVRYLEKH
jgi:hypothetical protein